MDKKTEYILQGITANVIETQKFVEECRLDIERKKGVVAGLAAATTSLASMAEKIATEAKAAEAEGTLDKNGMALAKAEIKGVNGSHGVLLALLAANQKEVSLAKGQMSAYANMLQKMQGQVTDLRQKEERRAQEKKNEGKGEKKATKKSGKKRSRPQPVRQALGRDKKVK